ncbi:MAG: carboxypeptidase-like regulatory domain-containing protein [Ignavibacteriota bacterium]
MILRKVDPVAFQLDGLPAQSLEDGSVKLLGRHKDLAGASETQVLKLTNRTAILTAGPWEFALAPMDGYFVSGFMGSRGYRPRKHYDGWNELAILPRFSGNSARFALSTGPGGLHGTVTQSGDPVAGAPVFLESMDLEPERRLTDCFVAITDVQGRYRFSGLAPGRYRVFSTFEYQMPDSAIMTEVRALELQIDAHGDAVRDLDLYVIR